MARDTSGTKNQPQYAGTGAPADAADLSEVANYAADNGNRKICTTIQRNALTGADVWEGLFCGDTTDGFEYKRVGAAWVRLDGATQAEYQRSTGSDAGFTGYAGLISGTLVAAPAGLYRIAGFASLYAASSAGGFLRVVAAAASKNFRNDLTTTPATRFGEMFYQHAGGDLVIEVGYNCTTGTATVTAVGGGITSVSVYRVGS